MQDDKLSISSIALRELQKLAPDLVKAFRTQGPDDFSLLCQELRATQTLGAVLRKAMPLDAPSAATKPQPRSACKNGGVAREISMDEHVAGVRQAVSRTARETARLLREPAVGRLPAPEQQRQQVNAIMSKALTLAKRGMITSGQVGVLESRAAAVLRTLASSR